MEPEGRFDATKERLGDLLDEMRSGKLQLPDFQRGWVWDDEHVRSLLASVSLSFPIGAVMLLDTGNPKVRFRPRPIEGARVSPDARPDRLILDGQQRLTSLFQAFALEGPVVTVDSRKNRIERFYYIDLRKALEPGADREEAIISVPPDRLLRGYPSGVTLDLSSQVKECEAESLPVRALFDIAELFSWSNAYAMGPDGPNPERYQRWQRIVKEVIQPIQQYMVPLIRLNRDTSKQAVCQVFEKVNTGGVSLSVFELLTATYAADNFSLRDEWDRIAPQLHQQAVLEGVENTEFLQVVTLLATYARKQEGGQGAIGCKRADILNLELSEFERWKGEATKGYLRAARLLHDEKFFDSRDVPYRTQLVPLAAIFAILGVADQPAPVLAKLRRWFWCGVLGELYGGSIETRFARDVPQVVAWASGGPEPESVTEAIFIPDRLRTLKRRNSAAYKGLHVLLMRAGAVDLKSGSLLDSHIHFVDPIDIHHIFPSAWADRAGLPADLADSIVNKTPLTKSTNLAIGGSTPSAYLSRLEALAGVGETGMDKRLETHAVEPRYLRADDFHSFYRHRSEAILDLIEEAMGKPVMSGQPATPGHARQFDGTEAADGVLVVEGATDAEYLRIAARVSGREDLLSRISIRTGDGVSGAMRLAVEASTGDLPVVVLLDRDENGKAVREQLTGRMGFSRRNVLSCAEVLDGSPDNIESEDLFPPDLLQRFVDRHGEHAVLSEKQFHPQRKQWRYGFNAVGKSLIADFLAEEATGSDVKPWIKLLELVRARMGLSVGHEAGAARSNGFTATAEHQRSDAPPDRDEPDAISPSAVDRPWRTDGRSWHLERRTTPFSRPIVEAIVGLIGQIAELEGPRWNQRRYIAWRLRGRNAVTLWPSQYWAWLEVREPSIPPQEAAVVLGLNLIPEGSQASLARRGESQVGTAPDGALWFLLRDESLVIGSNGDRLVDLVRRALPAGDVNLGSGRGGFDWSVIEAAVRLLPRDRWTSYMELARLGGTAPVPVGQHMANVPLPNAYRVLDSGGRIRDGFRWNNPTETRDVRDVLLEDGIRINESGQADPAQKLEAGQLRELLNRKAAWDAFNPDREDGATPGASQT